MNYLLKDEISKFHLTLLLILTLVLALIGSMLHIPGIMEHPQFTQKLNPELVGSILNDNSIYKIAYYSFFMVDFVWAPTLLLAIWKYLKRGLNKWGLWFFGLIIPASYGLDVAENIIYIFQHRFIDWIVLVKTITYAASFVGYLYHLLKRNWHLHSDAILTFLKSSFLSLFILVLIGLLLPKATQINSIVVNLYNDPWNLLVLLAIAPLYASFLAHYPSYFSNLKSKKWKKRGQFLLGIISTKRVGVPNYVENNLNFLYRTIGILFYSALFYFIAFTSEVNFNWPIGTGRIAFVIMVLGIYFLYKFKTVKDYWLKVCHGYLSQNIPNFYDGDSPAQISAKNNQKPDNFNDIVKPVTRGFYWFFITIISHVAFAIYLLSSASNEAYNEMAAIWSLLCIALQTVSYIYFRSYRSAYLIVLYHSNFPNLVKSFTLDSKDLSYQDQINQINKFFDENKFERGAFLEFIAKRGWGIMGSSGWFLKGMTYFGLINALLMIVLNINSDLAFLVNTTLIILAYLLLYYGMFTLLGKHLIYYKSIGPSKATLKFRNYLFAIAVIVVALRVWTKQDDNGMFTLKTLNISEQTLGLEEYAQSISKLKTRYYIGSYGGGMKANAWTLAVLNQFHQKDPKFFENVVVMSGASGGTIGIMNMSAALMNKPNQPALNKIINDISTTNMLSMDFVHALGRDAVGFMFVPNTIHNLSGYDRSTKAMNKYATLSGNNQQTTNPSTFRSYWDSLYYKRKHHPILIANTTNVKGNQGMGVSVNIKDKLAYETMYNGANNILEIGNSCFEERQTLSYYNAFSTSNRFPIISPAAKIESMGQFNDGGIYENSGLLSAYKTFRAIESLESRGPKDSTNTEVLHVFINIVNDKNLYIKKYFKDKLTCLDTINESSEIGAVLNSVAATEMMPMFIKSKLQTLSNTALNSSSNIRFETIYLPHRFTVADVENALGGELNFGQGKKVTKEYLYEKMLENDSLITELIGGDCIIEPPMSRVLAPQSVDFMHEMLNHKITDEAINKTLSYRK